MKKETKEPTTSISAALSTKMLKAMTALAEKSMWSRAKLMRWILTTYVMGRFDYAPITDEKGKPLPKRYKIKVADHDRSNPSIVILVSVDKELQRLADDREITKNALIRHIMTQYMNGELKVKKKKEKKAA